MPEPAPDLDPDIVPGMVAPASRPVHRVAAELLSVSATIPVDLDPLLADLHTAQAAVPLIVDLLDLAHIPSSDAARLVLAIRRSARDGRQIVVMVGDPQFEGVPALLAIPGVVVCATLDEAERAIG